jgi:hypothetical protein
MSDTTKAPQRIQRKRTKGWRMPDGAVYVGRGSRWGNPYVMRDETDRAAAVAWFKTHVAPTLDVTALRGKDLACWCPVGQACHGDVLLEMANE